MVQRKVPDKLGIQADSFRQHDQKRLLSLKKPSSSYYQDGKNRPDLKKMMMKKSRSFKLSDIDHQSLKSSSSSSLMIRKSNISQPGKPPPPSLYVQSTSQTQLLSPQKQPPITKGATAAAYGSPNYMKSTSCFDARKELQSQVSLQNSHSRLNWRNSSCSITPASNSKKQAKNSNKASSSLKLVRTLTKTPSFKHSRTASAKKKSSRVALCTADHVNVQRATCSSTLKDSKFPSYLMLNHGGTESEGTSVMKVCPYTYCSLNGHLHHAILPPLKHFLSARRRSLKTQKNVKLQVLTPPHKIETAPSIEELREIDSVQVKFDDEEEAKEKVGMDFFIEIYAKTLKDDEKRKTDFKSSQGGEEEKEVVAQENYIEEQVVESLSDRSPQSEIDTEESLERYENCNEEEGKDYKDGDYLSFSVEEETEGCYSNGRGSEATDMEWEEGKFSDTEFEDEADNLSEMDEESESVSGYSSEFEGNSTGLLEEGYVINQDDGTSDQVGNASEDTNESKEDNETNDGQNGTHKTEESSEIDKQIDLSGDLSLDSADVLEETDQDKVSEEIPAPDSSQATPEPNDHETAHSGNSEQEIDQNQNTHLRIHNESEDHSNVNLRKTSDIAQDSKGEIENMEVGKKTEPELKPKPTLSISEQRNDDHELRNSWKRRGIKDLEEEETTRKFNPREPNFLPLMAEPEGEKVDLKHQMMDERKNAEEWMIDYALQRAVTKLAPARKKKVALLVEAFEAVTPITKCESHRLRHHHPSPAFSQAIRPIQACS